MMGSDFMRRLQFFVQGVILAGGLICGLFALQVFAWSMDDRPPFTVLAYESFPAKAGKETVIIAKVHRQLHRECSVTYDRYFYDSNGMRWELFDEPQKMNAAALGELERLNPGSLKLSIRVPENAAVGKATVVTSLDYVCNPWHLIKPIPVLMEVTVEVTPS